MSTRDPGVSQDGAVAAAGHETGTNAEPPDLEPPEPEPPEREWPDYYASGRTRPSYAFTLAASPWFKERYPDKAANLSDALHAGRSGQANPEPGRSTERSDPEAGG
jgi:hypothetical protein